MRPSRTSRQDSPRDVGTLWTMVHRERSARCALMAWPQDWEVRVQIDGAILHSERCERADDAFELAGQWKRRLLGQGWRPVVPRPRSTAQPAS